MSVAELNSPTHGTRAAAGSATTAMTRDPRLDFFRGIVMFIILIAHTPGNWVTRWIPARFGFSDATEVFVFLSGMASAMAFGLVFAKQGWAMGTARVAFRCWQVYWAHIGLFFAIAGTMVVLNTWDVGTRDYVGQLNLYPFFNNAQTNLVGLLTLSYVPNYFDILPMYLVVLALMPLVIGLRQIHGWLAIGFCVALWLLAQEGLQAAYLGDSEGDFWPLRLELSAEPWSEREWFFNPFGWQLVFFTGFALMAGWLPKPPVHPVLIGGAVLVVLANVAFSHIGMREFGFDWAREWRIANRELITKTDFGILRYVHFLALAYLAWILVGPKGARLLPPDHDGMLARTWRLLLAWIMKVGQQSLAAFITSMYLARLLGVMLDELGRNYLSMTMVNLFGFAVMILVAYGVGWFKSQPWRKRKPA